MPSTHKRGQITSKQINKLKNNYTFDVEKYNVMVEEYWKDIIIQKLIAEGRLRNEKDIKYFKIEKEKYENGNIKYSARIVPISVIEDIQVELFFE